MQICFKYFCRSNIERLVCLVFCSLVLNACGGSASKDGLAAGACYEQTAVVDDCRSYGVTEGALIYYPTQDVKTVVCIAKAQASVLLTRPFLEPKPTGFAFIKYTSAACAEVPNSDEDEFYGGYFHALIHTTDLIGQ